MSGISSIIFIKDMGVFSMKMVRYLVAILKWEESTVRVNLKIINRIQLFVGFGRMVK